MMISEELELTKAALAEVQRENDDLWTERMRRAADLDRYLKEREYNLAVIEQRNAMLTEANRDRDITQEELAELKAQDADRLKTIGRLAQELFDTRKERDALKRAQVVTE
jgi:hypothetical protein